MTVRVTEALSCMGDVMRIRYKECGLPRIQLPPSALAELARCIEDDLNTHLYAAAHKGFKFDGIEFVPALPLRAVPEFWKWKPVN